MAARKARGLILGGGGAVGLAWEVGVLAGLAAERIDLRTADEVIGTSAGAFAAVALAHPRGIEWTYERQRMDVIKEVSATFAPDIFQTFATIIRESGRNVVEAGRRFGAYALKAPPAVDPAGRFEVVRSRLDCAEWPARNLKFTAIDAETGELHLLDSDSGIDLAHAAAASGAVPGVWPVVEAGGKRWIDGGSVSPTNVHFAARFQRCVVISPAPANIAGVPVQKELQATAPQTAAVVIVPDADSVAAIGPNPFDPTKRRGAAEAGRAQGLRLAGEVRKVWDTTKTA
jgi:NTE family protein